MQAPSRADYVRFYFTLFDRFEQAHPAASHRGRPLTYAQRLMIVFFTCMLLRRISEFKAQQRWLSTHLDDAQQLGFTAIPHAMGRAGVSAGRTGGRRQSGERHV